MQEMSNQGFAKVNAHLSFAQSGVGLRLFAALLVVAAIWFLVCTSCRIVSEFDAGGAARVPRGRASGFAVQSMNVELSGLCKKCQATDLHK